LLSAKLRVLNPLCCFYIPADFDEQTADDWDVDMSVYYDTGTEQAEDWEVELVP
jgi:hypothetical protein